jgi:hypothetical protein
VGVGLGTAQTIETVTVWNLRTDEGLGKRLDQSILE